MSKNISVLVGGKSVSLTKNNFKASGGEGDVYVRGNTAYKIYHDSKKVIPAGKIKELQSLKSFPTILGPNNIITNKDGKEIGFTMDYKKDTEFLCKLFINGFRSKNNISFDTLRVLVEQLREVLKQIHKKNILVVDYNEMNFLVDTSFSNVFHIDVDSWQTPNYKATAIMESIRDRQISDKNFTELSDWFSWGIIAFQLYIGTHPYKGRHPDYKPKDWLKMMDEGISVFNQKCSLSPKASSLSVIPEGHRKWFEKVFEHGERSVPPKADEVIKTIGYQEAKIVVSNNKITAKLLYEFPHKIINVLSENFGSLYALTNQGIIFGGESKYKYLLPKHTKGDDFKLFFSYGKWMLLHIFKYEAKTDIYELSNNLNYISQIPNNKVQIYNNSILSFVGSAIYEYSCKIFNSKIYFPNMLIGNIMENSHKIFDNVVVQNIFGIYYFVVPIGDNKTFTLSIEELKEYRIVEAKHRDNQSLSVVMVVAEKGGIYDRFVFCINKKNSLYTVRKDENVDLEELNFDVRDDKIFVSCFNQQIEIFKDNSKINKIENINIQEHQKIFCIGNKSAVISGEKIYILEKK